MKPKQWTFQKNSSTHVKRLMDSFVVLNTPLLPLVNPPMCIGAIYAKNKSGIEKRCSLQIKKTNIVNISTPIAPNVWILTSAYTALSIGIMLICPKEAPRFIKTLTPIHVLWWPPACSTTFSISTYHHVMKAMSLLSTYLSMQLISSW